jgi:hypothetical protein
MKLAYENVVPAMFRHFRGVQNPIIILDDLHGISAAERRETLDRPHPEKWGAYVKNYGKAGVMLLFRPLKNQNSHIYTPPTPDFKDFPSDADECGRFVQYYEQLVSSMQAADWANVLYCGKPRFKGFRDRRRRPLVHFHNHRPCLTFKSKQHHTSL